LRRARQKSRWRLIAHKFMAVKIEKGGWALIFVVGLALVGYSLYKYNILDVRDRFGSKSEAAANPPVDTSKPLVLPVSSPAGSSCGTARIRVNIWVGCAAGLVANGGLDTAAGSIYDKKGLKVSFKIIDDWTEGAAALATDNVDVMLTTADVWAKDFAQFQEKGVGAHAFFMVDWSRGADGVIGKQGINTIEDLAGKTVAFAPYTPSHFLLWNGLKGSGLDTDQRREIFNKAVHTKDGIEPATLFAQQKVDAAVAWDPDMSDAVAKRAGSKKIYDTRIANHLIADILVVSDRFASRCPQTVVNLAEGWLEGVEFIKAQPNRAYTLIGTIKDFNIPEDLAKTMLGGVKLADYADNQAFFGTRGADSDYNNIFKMAQEMYREERVVKRNSDPESSVDRRFIEPLGSKFSTASSEPPTEYREPAKNAVPIATQRRSIYFDTDSANMGLDSRAVVDEIGVFMKAYGNTVVDIDGNTDGTGSRGHNVQLSRERAEAVKRYLVEKYNFPPERMRAVGNGPDRPVADNSTLEGREKNRRTDIKVYPNPAG
jgi:NitT/TauT family transport system substrate-binding protein